MIEIELYGKEGIMPVDEHPEYLDFARRDSRTRTRQARVAIALENIAAPLATRFAGRTAIAVYAELQAARAILVAKHGGREDGIRFIDQQLSWGRRWPKAIYRVTGAERVPVGERFITTATMPRFSSHSLTADPIGRGVRYIGEADRMDEVDETVDDLLPDLDAEIWGAKLLQREIPIKTTGGGTKSKIKKKKAGGGAGMVIGGIIGSTPPGYEYDETKIPRAVFGVRIPVTAKTALQESGVAPELIGLLGAALMSGKTIEQVRKDLQAC